MIAPWLVANNPLTAMERGAALGLQLRSQQEASERAAAQLALEQDRLNLTHQHYRDQSEQAAAHAAEALRQHTALEMFRQQNLQRQQEAQAARDAQAERRTQVMENALLLKPSEEDKEDAARRRSMFAHDYGAWRSDYSATQRAHSDAVKKLNAFNTNPMTVRREKAGDASISATRQTLTDAIQSAADRLKELQQQGQQQGLLTAPPPTQEPPAFPLPMLNLPGNNTPSAAQALTIRSPSEIPSSGMLTQESAPTVTTKEQFDALPSGAVYTGKDGRKYRKP